MAGLRTYIKHLGEFIELRDGQPLVAGRSPECGLPLDDELASREHCRFELIGEVVKVVDLDSHNGLLLNGLEIDGEARVHHGDVLTVGSTMIAVIRQHREVPKSVPIRASAELSAQAEEFTTTATLEEILIRGARRSLTHAQLQEADQTARILFPELRSRTHRGSSGLKENTLHEAVAIGLELAERLGEATWLDQVLDLLASAERPLGTQTARFRAAVQKVGRPPRGLEDYLAMLQREGLSAHGLDLL